MHLFVELFFVVLVFVSFVFANESQNSGFKLEGTRSKIYNDGIVFDFEIYCGQWLNNEKKCLYLSSKGKSHIDSTIY